MANVGTNRTNNTSNCLNTTIASAPTKDYEENVTASSSRAANNYQNIDERTEEG
ncbi:19380_t:CDS:2, partial [Cetraspora pellucida]